MNSVMGPAVNSVIRPTMRSLLRWEHWRAEAVLTAIIGLSACGGGTAPAGPSTPSTPASFLAGTWHGTVTIQVNPGDPDASAPMTGAIDWTFEVVPQTNLQTFRSTMRAQHPWLPTSMTGTTALVPQNVPPTQVSTHGAYDSPRGCRGTYGSLGTADTARIEADFTGVDCNHTTFTGRIVLTKN